MPIESFMIMENNTLDRNSGKPISEEKCKEAFTNLSYEKYRLGASKLAEP